MEKNKFSVIIPVYNVSSNLLYKCIRSVLNQTYENFEICICNDGSTLSETNKALEEIGKLDPRIKITSNEQNSGISKASIRAIEISDGEFITLLDNDDTISETALEEFAKVINSDEEVDFIYTDESKQEFDGNLVEPYLKPIFSQIHLQSVMYVLHMMCFKRELYNSVGGFDPELSGSQDYDLCLRLTDVAKKIHHIPKQLYFWRKIPGSAALKIDDSKKFALKAARKAIEKHVKKKFEGATVEDGYSLGSFRVRPKLNAEPLVSLIIPTNNKTSNISGRGDINLAHNFITSILEKTTYKNYEIIIADNGILSKELEQLVAENENIYRHSFTYEEGKFNFADKANFAFEKCRGEFVVMLNDDMEVISPDWIESQLECMEFDKVGIVGSMLLFENGTIQHAGVVLSGELGCSHIFYDFPNTEENYWAFSHLIREYTAVTGAGMMVRKSIVDELNGFDNFFALDYNDIDFNLRAGKLGYKIVYTPYSKLYHFESRTAQRSWPDPVAIEEFRRRWGNLIENDPYFHIDFVNDEYRKYVLDITSPPFKYGND